MSKNPQDKNSLIIKPAVRNKLHLEEELHDKISGDALERGKSRKSRVQLAAK
jgi:hypothetical protein